MKLTDSYVYIAQHLEIMVNSYDNNYIVRITFIIKHEHYSNISFIDRVCMQSIHSSGCLCVIFLGQFWHIKVEAERYNVTAEDNVAPSSQHYAVTVNGPRGMRRFLAWKHHRTWDKKSMTCLYAGDAHGGPVYEATSLSDPVIEGTYNEYKVSGLFATEYKYEMFESEC